MLTNERNYGARADFVKHLRLSRRNLCYILLCKHKRRKTNTPPSGALRGVPAGRGRGCLKSRLLFRQPVEFKIKSLYHKDLILNIAYKIKEAAQKLKFLDSREGKAFPLC